MNCGDKAATPDPPRTPPNFASNERSDSPNDLSESPSGSKDSHEADKELTLSAIHTTTTTHSRRSGTSRAFSSPYVPTDEHADKTILEFEHGDPDNPYNWPLRRKIFVLLAGIVAVLNSTLGSSMPSGAINYIGRYFHITNDQQLVLPISLFLVGYVVGPVFFGPLSETYGRRVIMLATFAVFTIFTLACALAPTWPAFLVFRLICGINASSPIAVVGGLFADVFDDPVTRGRAMAVFMAATASGPMISPTISGFVSVVSWRWAFWVSLIIAGASLAILLFLPETYGPTILARRAHHLRHTKPDTHGNTYAAIELESTDAKQLVTVILMRPITMLLFEPIVTFTCLYLALAYGIFYLFFEAYPLIFQSLYRMSTGVSGLAFLPILGGVAVALAIFLYYDTFLLRAQHHSPPKAWSLIEEYRRLPLACLGGPAYVLALFWLGWTSRASIPPVVPMLAGIPFGIGFMLIFMALLNYLADAYNVYAASAMAAGSLSRSVFGALLPLAAQAMYKKLGIAWASTLLALVSAGMSAVPFAFVRWGGRMRAGSKFCLELKAKREREEAEREKRRRRRRRGDSADLTHHV